MTKNYQPLQRLEIIYQGWGEHFPLGQRIIEEVSDVAVMFVQTAQALG